MLRVRDEEGVPDSRSHKTWDVAVLWGGAWGW